MQVSKLPTSWCMTPIGEFCDLINGRAFKSTEWTDKGLPIIRIQNLNNSNANFNFFNGELDSKHRVETGDLLFAWSGTPGTSFGAHIWGGNVGALNQHIFKVVFNEFFIDKRFIRYAINQTLDELISGAHGGVGLRHVTKGRFETTKIIFPSLAEQKIIADKLDTILAQVETTKIRLERISEILKTFRQSVLTDAVSGKLTEEWRNHINIDWPQKKSKLSDLIELVYGKSLPAKSRSGDEFPVFGSNGIVGRHKEYLVEGPFIVVGRKGSYGEVTWSDTNGWPIDTTYFVNLKQASDLKFVFFLLQTLGLNQLNRATAIPGLNREDAYSQTIIIPKIQEQAEIVHRVEDYFSYADNIEQKAQAALECVNKLTQSILSKAFCGELTADWRVANPDLISGDNSAEALLEKIKVERESIKRQPKLKYSPVKNKIGSRMSKKIIKVAEALKRAGEPLSGQQLLVAAGYPSDSSTDQLELFFLDLRDALVIEKSIIKLKRGDDSQDWFALAKQSMSKEKTKESS